MNASKLTALVLLVSGCATTPREKVIQNILIGSTVGFIVGQSREENRLASGLIYGGVAGATAGLATAYFDNSDQEIKKMKDENQRLTKELEKAFSPELNFESSGTLNSKIPEKYKSMINPGEWKIYSLDQWIEDGENRLIHQDKMMELNPPSLKPISLPQVKNRK